MEFIKLILVYCISGSKVLSSFSLCCPCPLPALKHFAALVPFTPNGIFKVSSLFLFLCPPHNIVSEGGRCRRTKGEKVEAEVMAWGKVGALKSDGGKETGRKMPKQSVVYFYHMHFRSCTLKFPLHVFLIPTAIKWTKRFGWVDRIEKKKR